MRQTKIARWPVVAAAVVVTFVSASARADAPSILIYSVNTENDYLPIAATDLGWNVTMADETDFNTLVAGGGWDVIAVSAPDILPINGEFIDWTPLANAILCDDARVVISMRDPTQYTGGSLLMYAIQCRGWNDLITARDLYVWQPAHPLLNTPNSVDPSTISFTSAWPDPGNKLRPEPGAVAVAGFTSFEVSTESGIVISRDGRVIINGQLIDCAEDAAPAIALWQNELTYVLNAPSASEPCDAELPLQLWLDNMSQPIIEILTAVSPSVVDYDRDGWHDAMTCFKPHMYHNEQGNGFVDAVDLEPLLHPYRRRYGASFGDYNNDGLPDMSTEPRSPGPQYDDCTRFLKNLGDGVFEDVSDDVVIGGFPCGSNGETNCWGDVDGDGNLDVFVPAYPDSSGNLYFHNLGPDETGEYHFVEMVNEAQLFNPPGVAKPEGAMFCDYDFDGDIDLFSNGVVYQNNSLIGFPYFHQMSQSESGVGYRNFIDEGLGLFDYDMDGDFDLVVAYISEPPGVMIHENRGDGTFFPVQDRVDCAYCGLQLGLSYVDWDMDGDIDLNTRDTFRRNMLMETGEARFEVQRHDFISGSLRAIIFAYGDFDQDGDSDAIGVQSLSDGYFYKNTKYDSSTPMAERRHVRVRALRAGGEHGDGLETEFGAVAQLEMLNAYDGLKRTSFVSSSGGYINQNEYDLVFALPPDPEPLNAAEDVRFNLAVTFPDPDGIRRVDRFVNPALGDLNLADLTDRTLRVYRDGSVIMNGMESAASATEDSLLTAAAGGLDTPVSGHSLPVVLPTPTTNYFSGIEVSVPIDGPMVRVREIVVDGILAEAVACDGTTANVVVWDVTNPASKFITLNGAIHETPNPRNNRSHIPANIVLEAGRRYLFLANLYRYRQNPRALPSVESLLTVDNAVWGIGSACNETNVGNVQPNSTAIQLTILYSEISEDCNENGIVDSAEVAGGFTTDCNLNGIPDDCDWPGCSGFIKGDMNCDGLIDGDDIQLFVETTLTNVDSCAADLDANGVINANDFSEFVLTLLDLMESP